MKLSKGQALCNRCSLTKAQANLFKIMAFVNDNSQPLTLTNSKGKNAVLVGEDDWNVIMEWYDKTLDFVEKRNIRIQKYCEYFK